MTTTVDAKEYLSQRDIPQLFECLMTGLMYNRPRDHIDYLLECLQKAKKIGIEQLKWNIFIEHQRRSARRVLPPIGSVTPQNEFRSRDPSFITEPSNMAKSSVLPPINDKVPNCPIVFICGAPGSNKGDFSNMLLERYSGWIRISVGDIIRQKIENFADRSVEWKSAKKLVQEGELAPQDLVMQTLKDTLAENMDAKGVLIEGYPRTLQQAEEYDKTIGRVDVVFLMDFEEVYLKDVLRKRLEETSRIDNNEVAGTRKLRVFMENTLALLKHYDDQNKLIVIECDGDRERSAMLNDLAVNFDSSIIASGPFLPHPPTNPKSEERSSSKVEESVERPQSEFPPPVTITTIDSGRGADLPQCPIIIVLGGPGSGRKELCERLLTSRPLVNLVNMGELIRSKIQIHSEIKWINEADKVKSGQLISDEVAFDLLYRRLEELKDSQLILLEGFPRNKKQVDDLNAKIGGIKHVILVDAAENEMRDNSEKNCQSNEEKEIVNSRIKLFKHKTLPILSYFDDSGKLTIINGCQSSLDKIFEDFERIFNDITAINPSGTEGNDTAPISGGDKSKEESLIKEETDAKTGENVENPIYSAELDNVPVEQNITMEEEAKLGDKGNTDYTKELNELSTKEPEPPKEIEANVYFVLGGPGSGKGTQCDKLVEKYGFCHLSSGDLLRDEVKSGSARGEELNKTMERGELVSLDIVLQLIREAMQKAQNPKGFLIDGYPRELDQGLRFEKEVKEVSNVIYFNVNDEIMVQRLLKRGETSGRIDDNEETIKKRLNTFHQLTQPTIDHYAKQGKTLEIKADGTVDEIFAQVCNFFDQQ